MKYRLMLVAIVIGLLGGGSVFTYAQSTPVPTGTPAASSVIQQDIFVRGGPGRDYLPVGKLLAGDRVRPLGRNAQADWVLIVYGKGYGWIRRDLAFWVENINALPILDVTNLTPSPVLPTTPTRTPVLLPTTTPVGNWVQLDVDAQSGLVRAGPGRTYLRLGQLFNGDVVEPVSQNVDGSWIMIRFENGFGWIARNLVHWVDNLEALPVVSVNNLTPSATFVVTDTLVPTITLTPSVIPTLTRTPSPTAIPTLVPTLTITPVPSATETLVPTVTPSSTLVPTSTVTQTATLVATVVPTAKPTETQVPTVAPSSTPVPTSTATQTATLIATVVPTATAKPTETQVPTVAPSSTPVPTSTATQTATLVATAVPTLTPKPTETQVPTVAPSSTSTSSATATHEATAVSTATYTSTLAFAATTIVIGTPTVVEVVIVPSATVSLRQTRTATVTSTSSSIPPTKTITASVTATLTRTLVPPTHTATPAATFTAMVSTATSLLATHTPIINQPSVTISVTVTQTASVPTQIVSPTVSPTLEQTRNAGGVSALTPTPTISGSNVVPNNSNGPSPEVLIAGIVLLVILVYAVSYWRGLSGSERYASGFVIETCPVCQRGHLIVESRQERLFGIPRARHSVRCTECRSVLREVTDQQWRYAVDPIANPDLYQRFNGKIIHDQTLIDLSHEQTRNTGQRSSSAQATPPDFVDDDT